MKHLIFISSLFVLFSSCTRQQKVSPEVLFEQRLAEKIDDYLKEKNRDCIDNALLQAEIYVDSIIYDMTKFSVLDDSINMIQKPSKPNRPDYLKIKDPGPIVPFELKKE